MNCPICGGTRLVSQRRPKPLRGYLYGPCWACTPQPIRHAA